jgi:hypothetical protein
MKLSQNWVTADIKKDLEHFTMKFNQSKAEGNDKMANYYQGIVRGIEISLTNIEQAYAKGGK